MNFNQWLAKRTSGQSETGPSSIVIGDTVVPLLSYQNMLAKIAEAGCSVTPGQLYEARVIACSEDVITLRTGAGDVNMLRKFFKRVVREQS